MTSLNTLILEADYRPRSYENPPLVSLRRAMKGVLKGNLIVLETWDQIASPDHPDIQLPAVAVRRHSDPTAFHRFRTPRVTRLGVLLRDGYRCMYCAHGQRFPIDKLSVDHIIPRSKGGSDEWLNVGSACKLHNSMKSDTDPKRFRLPRQFEPTVPTAHQLQMLAREQLRSRRIDPRQMKWLLGETEAA